MALPYDAIAPSAPVRSMLRVRAVAAVVAIAMVACVALLGVGKQPNPHVLSVPDGESPPSPGADTCTSARMQAACQLGALSS
jgi:hypothetical protein